MAGNPLVKYLPWMKQNAVSPYLGIGVFLFFYRQRLTSKTYKMVYSKNDFERRYHLEKLEEFLEK